METHLVYISDDKRSRPMNFSPIQIFALILVLVPALLPAKVTEKELAGQNEIFLEALVRDTPHLQQEIHACLNTSLTRRGSGARLLDRFGIFLNDCRADEMTLTKTRFFHWERGFAFFLIFTDAGDGQMYTLYLEYALEKGKKASHLREIYFSPVFTERMTGLRLLFGGDEENGS